ncbi:hypothetical protein [Salinarimonas soli]|uniref:Uncharacterized protein n=1 Tax=Salinarimonas soli TaxID=1638099 RepID=A0A5B2VHG4_9HYPH|nr:hypothetical protein [Salinarimonas soli]KAA2237792.1 hypothetical protein F0L46_08965 [Salinarimonas soli]
MTPRKLGCAALAFAALGLAPVAVLAGPCDDDIAVLKRQLGSQVGLGAPVSEPDRGQTPAPAQVGQGAAEPGATSSTDRAQPGGASRTAGGSPGTVGGVAGPATAATGTGTGGGIASGSIATSAEDVRRQSEGLPTTAVQASRGTASPEAAAADKSSQAKTALQRAVDLNAAGDRGCTSAVTEARNLMPK